MNLVAACTLLALVAVSDGLWMTTGAPSGPWSQRQVAKKFHNKFMTGLAHGTEAPGSVTRLPRDLLFIIDMSGSISRGEWQTAKAKLAELVEKLCGTVGRGRYNNRVAFITYSSRVVLNFNFKTHWTIESVKQAILNMEQERRITCTGDALSYAHQYMFEPDAGARPATESVKEVLVLTDGVSNCGAPVSDNAVPLKEKAFVSVVPIGHFGPRGRNEIESIASRPLNDHIFSVANFAGFVRMADQVLPFPYKCSPMD